MRIKRALALSTTLVVAALGTSAVTANAAVAGQHKGQAQHSTSQDQQSRNAKAAQGKAAQGKAAQGKGKADAARTSHAGGNGKSHAGGNGKSHAGGNGKGQGGGSGDPAGNNGTVKIAPLGDFDGIPNNTPHPGCQFLIEWYGFDEGADIISTVTFAMQAPTSDVGLTVDGPSQVFVGGDPATGAGTDTGLDGRQQYTLSFDGAPQPQQGYHVKLTINTPYSQGADVKHKVFWVSPCEDTSGSAAASGGDTSSSSGGDTGSTSGSDTQVAGEQATSSNSGGDTAVAGEQAAAGTQVAGEQAAAGKGANANLPTKVNAGGSALDWILSPVPLMVIALGAALLAFGIVSRRRRA